MRDLTGEDHDRCKEHERHEGRVVQRAVESACLLSVARLFRAAGVSGEHIACGNEPSNDLAICAEQEDRV